MDSVATDAGFDSARFNDATIGADSARDDAPNAFDTQDSAVDTPLLDTSVRDVIPTDVILDAADAGPAAPRFIGRFDFTSAAGPTFEWSGSEIVAAFTGTTIAVRLHDASATGNYFAVLIDGGAPQRIHTSSATDLYPLASGLAPGSHQVLVHRRTEAFFGAVQFLGFVTDPGHGLVPLPPPATRRIELVGDSISAGYGNEGAGPTCTFSGDTENHYLSYGALAARTLGADLITTAWSGIGMYRDYGGSTANTMPLRYGRTLPEVTTSVWDFTQWTPDVVVINLGTNDYAQGDPGAPFLDAYTRFVQRVRGNYPRAWVLLALGPMLTDPHLSAARTALNAVITARHNAGDLRVSLVEFPTQSASNGYGCDYHPSLATDQMMATQLAGAIRTVVGW